MLCQLFSRHRPKSHFNFTPIIDPLKHAQIGVATTYGKPYFKFINALTELDVKYSSLLPEEIENYDGSLVLTTRDEAPKNPSKPILCEEIFNKHLTVIRGMIIQKLDIGFDKDELLIGIDPGERIGMSVSYLGRDIESSLYTSVEELVSHVISILAELKAKRKIVKIGNGNMKIARKISNLLNLKFCSDFELEFVDEQKTTLKVKNHNQRGKRDMLSAKYISQRDGYTHYVLPLSRMG